jgi:hypothetical protein
MPTSSTHLPVLNRNDDRRSIHNTSFILVELDPREVVNGKLVDGGLEAESPISSGEVRECCPHCLTQPLQLVVRFQAIKRSHLFCPQCTRCYDALYANGSSALDIGAAVI